MEMETITDVCKELEIGTEGAVDIGHQLMGW